MSCDRCAQLVSGQRIQSASQLREAITMLSRAIDAGIIEDVGPGTFGDPFSALTEERGWGRIVSNYFSCVRCNQAFHLNVRAHDGGGGALEEVSGTGG